MGQINGTARGVQSLDIHRGDLILISRDYLIRNPITPEQLSPVAPGILLESRAARLFTLLLHSVGAEGRIVPVSGYRSKAEQMEIFQDAYRDHGPQFANTYVALPDASEHQTGLAIDVALHQDTIDPITPHFPYSGLCQAFREAAPTYGFLERYPEGKEGVTGIGHEPWHFRYVGMPHARLITTLGLTLEEYLDWVKEYPFPHRPYSFLCDGRQYEISYLPADHLEALCELGQCPYTISGNHMDGYVLAAWRNGYEQD